MKNFYARAALYLFPQMKDVHVHGIITAPPKLRPDRVQKPDVLSRRGSLYRICCVYHIDICVTVQGALLVNLLLFFKLIVYSLDLRAVQL